MGKGKKIAIELISAYTCLSGLFLFVSFVFKVNFFQAFTSLLPVVFTFLIILFFFLSGLVAFLNPVSIRAKKLLIGAFLLQLCQVSILGVTFKNYFGPYLA
ncbi:MAG: hypothetical protein SFU21_12610, partial [Flavihumibacter sp.]|nr:hypothetical protein [Flavihumibacter sp.]